MKKILTTTVAALALTALTSVSAPPAHAYVICHDFRACHGPVQPR